MTRSLARLITFTIVLSIFTTSSACSQDTPAVPDRHINFPRFSSKALSGNLIGDPASRELLVLLPPSYFRLAKVRFPVVYYLHGLGKRRDGHKSSEGTFKQLYGEMTRRRLPEMILVAVDGTTIFGGSYYANSLTIGNFEVYVAEEVVRHIDSTYRTRASRSGRAIAGFSMGGHGALKIGMKYSGVFGQIGSLSGSPLSIRYRKSIYRKAIAGQPRPASLKELVEKQTFENNWSLAAAYAKAAAFSPNPKKPPLFLDIPFQTGAEERDPVWQKWLDDDPLSLVGKYREELATFDQIYIDHGEDETTLGTEDFLRELMRYGVGHTHFVFRGDHTDELYYRHLRMLRFLAVRWMGE